VTVNNQRAVNGYDRFANHAPRGRNVPRLVMRLYAAKRGGRARSQPGYFTGWLRGGWLVAGSFSAVMLACGCDCSPGVASGGRRVLGPRVFVLSGAVGGGVWHRQLARAVGSTHPRSFDRHPTPAEGDRAAFGAMTHRRPRRVMLALRPAHRGHVLGHDCLHHLQTGANREREQPLLHVLGNLTHRHSHRLPAARAAARRSSSTLVGILHGCLKTGSLYDENTAWQHRQTDTHVPAA